MVLTPELVQKKQEIDARFDAGKKIMLEIRAEYDAWADEVNAHNEQLRQAAERQRQSNKREPDTADGIALVLQIFLSGFIIGFLIKGLLS
jgi:hypothetical protein